MPTDGRRPVRLTVRLTPGAGLDRIDGVADGVLLARVAARPIDGAANVALVRLLATELDLASSRISLRMGARSRRKVIEIVGRSAESIRSRWPGIEV